MSQLDSAVEMLRDEDELAGVDAGRELDSLRADNNGIVDYRDVLAKIVRYFASDGFKIGIEAERVWPPYLVELARRAAEVLKKNPEAKKPDDSEEDSERLNAGLWALSHGWEATPVSLFDEEGVEGWRWSPEEPSDGNDQEENVVGSWEEAPEVPDLVLEAYRKSRQ